jgi:hypothetical protein
MMSPTVTDGMIAILKTSAFGVIGVGGKWSGSRIPCRCSGQPRDATGPPALIEDHARRVAGCFWPVDASVAEE